MKEPIIPYRTPMLINTVRVYTHMNMTYSVCPRCGIDIEYDYQRYCSTCGQALSWKTPEKLKIIYR